MVIVNVLSLLGPQRDIFEFSYTVLRHYPGDVDFFFTARTCDFVLLRVHVAHSEVTFQSKNGFKQQ